MQAEWLLGVLRRAAASLSVAESCTGGMLGAALTDVPGAAAVFWGGALTYHDAAKTELLGVQPAVLEEHGAVSEAVALAMAVGVRERARTTWSVAVTGIAGPSGGTEEKPVGTVWIAVDGPARSVQVFRFAGNRDVIRRDTVRQAIRLLMETVEAAERESPAL